MTLVVDTCVLIDIADEDPVFGRASASCLKKHLPKGLVISPISYIELAPVFNDSPRLLEEFLDGVGIDYSPIFDTEDRTNAFRAWARHVSTKRQGVAKRRPVADALIGALAMRRGGIITRNGADFHSFYPSLRIVNPKAARTRQRKKA